MEADGRFELRFDILPVVQDNYEFRNCTSSWKDRCVGLRAASELSHQQRHTDVGTQFPIIIQPSGAQRTPEREWSVTSVIALQAAERLAKTESLIDSVLIVQKQNDRMIRYGARIMSTLMFVVVAPFVGAGYLSIEVWKDIASLQTDVSLLQTDVSLLLEEISEDIAELRPEISSLKIMNGTVVHN